MVIIKTKRLKENNVSYQQQGDSGWRKIYEVAQSAPCSPSVFSKVLAARHM